MPYRITFALDLFNGPHERDLSRKSLSILLSALFKIDCEYLKTHPTTPLIYKSGIRYMEEPPGQEDWQDIPTCLKMEYCDCEDTACWRAAELVIRFNIPARPVFIEQKRTDGGMLYHILVEKIINGKIVYEDPSKILGMR